MSKTKTAKIGNGKTLTVKGTKEQTGIVIRFFKHPKVKQELRKRGIEAIRELELTGTLKKKGKRK